MWQCDSFLECTLFARYEPSDWPFGLGEMLTAGVTTVLHAMVMLARSKSDGLRIEAAPAESGSALVPELHHVCMFGASRLNCFHIESAYDHLLDLSSY
jgi:hypothetical protein